MPRKVLKRKKKIFDRKVTVRGFVNLLLVALVVGMGLLLAGSFIPKENFKMSKDIEGDVITQAPQSTNNNIELKPLTFTTKKDCGFDSIKEGCSCPATQKYAPYETDKPEQECYFVAPDKVNDECTLLKLCEKNEGKCSWNVGGGCSIPREIRGEFTTPGVEGAPGVDPNLNCAKWKMDLLSQPDKHWCVGKPVIYLYPENPTLVDVKLSIPGDIYISIPKYPSEGWQNILANPDGQLVYNGNDYKELYYETNVSIKRIPQNGIIIPTSQLRSKLLEITGKLGLKPVEQEEFLQYWLPKLHELRKNYIVFSLIDTSEKERIDGVDISPKPDVFINFLAYFKGIDYPISIDTLILPTPPARSAGFTAVEWGGTIDPSGQ